ncbi:MAG: hypothetical protein NVV74_25875 [Magnetospirillum sp.]|nr:hypothetical protein [Magnetospirillum sp.]
MVEEDLKGEALKRLRAVSFPADGSLVVIDEIRTVRLFRDSPGIEGRKVDAIPDGPERRALEAILATALAGRETVRYPWSSAADNGREGVRVGWVSRPATWGWTVAAIASETVKAEDGGGDSGMIWHFGLPALLLVLALLAVGMVALPPREAEGAPLDPSDAA